MKNLASRSKDLQSLRVYRQGIFAGVLSRTTHGCIFTFAPSFLENPIFQELSYRMPKQRQPYAVSGINLPPFFAGLLPEGLRLKAIQKSIKTSEDDLFSLFAATGAHTTGDVYAMPENLERPLIEAPKLNKISFYDFFQKLIQSDSYLYGEDAIAGVQEKFSTSMISFPLAIAKKNKNYILKINPKDKANLVENEFYCMGLANKCGIKTARVKIVFDKNREKGLLVERFDRVWNERFGQFTQLHQEDACQFLDLYPAEKYRISLNDIVENMLKITSSETLSVLKIIQQFCFSYLICNGDLHGKNISLLAQANGFVDISPAYDLITTAIYGDARMAIKIDGRDDNFKRNHFVDFAMRFRIPKLAINKMLDNLLRDFMNNYAMLEAIPMKNSQYKNLVRMAMLRVKNLASSG